MLTDALNVASGVVNVACSTHVSSSARLSTSWTLLETDLLSGNPGYTLSPSGHTLSIPTPTGLILPTAVSGNVSTSSALVSVSSTSPSTTYSRNSSRLRSRSLSSSPTNAYEALSDGAYTASNGAGPDTTSASHTGTTGTTLPIPAPSPATLLTTSASGTSSGAIFTIDGRIYTAYLPPNVRHATVVIQGSITTGTLDVSHPITLPGGQLVAMAPSGKLVVGNEGTVRLTALPAEATTTPTSAISVHIASAQLATTQTQPTQISSPTASSVLPISLTEVTLALGSSILTAVHASDNRYISLEPGTQVLTLGRAAFTTLGHRISAAADGVVENGSLVNGKATATAIALTVSRHSLTAAISGRPPTTVTSASMETGTAFWGNGVPSSTFTAGVRSSRFEQVDLGVAGLGLTLAALLLT